MAEEKAKTTAELLQHLRLAKFQSHKIVMAGKIKSFSEPGKIEKDKWVMQIERFDGSHVEVKVDKEFFARGHAVQNDYFVVYEDGYQSWSPREAFENGYTRVG